MKSIHTLCVEVLRRVDERMKLLDGPRATAASHVPAIGLQKPLGNNTAVHSATADAMACGSTQPDQRTSAGHEAFFTCAVDPYVAGGPLIRMPNNRVSAFHAAVEPKPGPKAGETISTNPAKPWRIVSAAILLSRWRGFGTCVPPSEHG